MKLPGVVSRGVDVVDYCEYRDVSIDGMMVEVPEWQYTVCVFRGHVFRYCADGRLTPADDSDVAQVLCDGRNIVINEVMYPVLAGGVYDRQVVRVLRAHGGVIHVNA